MGIYLWKGKGHKALETGIQPPLNILNITQTKEFPVRYYFLARFQALAFTFSVCPVPCHTQQCREERLAMCTEQNSGICLPVEVHRLSSPSNTIQAVCTTPLEPRQRMGQDI